MMTYVFPKPSTREARRAFPDAMILRPMIDSVLVFERTEDAFLHSSRKAA